MLNQNLKKIPTKFNTALNVYNSYNIYLCLKKSIKKLLFKPKDSFANMFFEIYTLISQG